ncbi:MAG: hypothetical protein NVV63_02310 [Opitutus sp.]|nr:hypothetical protein [Opitutus sp.]
MEGFYDWDHAARKACSLSPGTEVLAEHRQKAIKEHRGNLLLWLGQYQNEKNETKPRLPLSLFAVRATEDDLKKSNGKVLRESKPAEDRHAWESVVKTLHILPYFGDTVFYRLTSMQMVGRPERGLLAPIPWFAKDWAKAKKRTDYPVKPILPFVNGYRFKWIAPYELVLDFYQGRSSLSARMKAVTIKLTFEDSQFFRSVESVPILGRFDSARVVIFPIFGALDGPSHMVIQAAEIPADILAATPVCAEVAKLSATATDTPNTEIGGFSWYEPRELSDYKTAWDAEKSERDIKQKAGIKVDTHVHMPVAAQPPVAPQLSLPIESVHSKHYLMVGGFLGFRRFFAAFSGERADPDRLGQHCSRFGARLADCTILDRGSGPPSAGCVAYFQSLRFRYAEAAH